MSPGARSTTCSLRDTRASRPSSSSGSAAEDLHGPVRTTQQWWRVAGAGPAHPPGPGIGAVLLDPPEHRGRQRLDLQAAHGLVEPAEQRRRTVVAVVGHAAQQVAELAHRRRRRPVVAGRRRRRPAWWRRTSSRTRRASPRRLGSLAARAGSARRSAATRVRRLGEQAALQGLGHLLRSDRRGPLRRGGPDAHQDLRTLRREHAHQLEFVAAERVLLGPGHGEAADAHVADGQGQERPAEPAEVGVHAGHRRVERQARRPGRQQQLLAGPGHPRRGQRAVVGHVAVDEPRVLTEGVAEGGPPATLGRRAR